MADDVSQEMINELTNKPITKRPLLLSDWVYINIKAGQTYLDEDKQEKTVGKNDRFRFIMDNYDSSGEIVKSAIDGFKEATFNIEGKQVCGAVVFKGGRMGSLDRIQCKVHIYRIDAIREVYDLTTNGSQLEVERVNRKALLNYHPGFDNYSVS